MNLKGEKRKVRELADELADAMLRCVKLSDENEQLKAELAKRKQPVEKTK